MEQPPDQTPHLEARVTDLVIRLLLLGAFVYWSLSLMRPFLPILIWAIVLTVALYPAYASLARRLGGRNRLAAVLITLLGLVILLGPVAALTANLIDTAQAIAGIIRSGTLGIPPPPPSVADWPVVGERAAAAWTLAATNLEATLQKFAPVLLPLGERLFYMISGVGGDVLRFTAAMILMGFLFGPGRRLAEEGRNFADRIVASRGDEFVDLAGATIRNVSRGVVGVAVLQALLAGVVLQLSGVPGSGLLAFAILILAIIQIGPFPVILPTVIWAWMTMTTGPAALLTVVLLAVGLLDNILKPMLMARGLSTPILVIFLGVLGGTLTYGLIGLFLGPIVLSVFYDVLIVWARPRRRPVAPPAPPTADPTPPD